MALHTELEIHRSAEELLGVVLALVRHIPRDMKQLIGGKLRDESLQVMVLIGRANMARNKRQHLDQLLESIWMINHLLRAMVNQHFISVAQHAKAMKLTAKEALRRVAAAPPEDLQIVANSYLGLFRQASHSHKDRAAVARALLRRGFSVDAALTKTFPPRRKPCHSKPRSSGRLAVSTFASAASASSTPASST